MKNLFITFFLGFSTFSCIEPYDFILSQNPAFLLVDGQIYDKDSSAVRLYYTNQQNNDPTNILIEDAKVQIIENGNKRISFVYDSFGEKYKPQDLTFKGCNNCTYQLNFVLADGKEYVSTVDTLKIPDQYDRIFDNYNPIKRKFEMYADLKPKSNINSYYQTYFINYEACEFCAECSSRCGYQVVPNLPCPGLFKSCNCKPDVKVTRTDFFYQFPCLPGPTRCWNFKRQRYYSIFTDDILGIGTKRTQKLLEVPLSDYTRYYVEVYQNNVTTEAYIYLKNLEQDGQKSGTLVDPVPPVITGNVFLKEDLNKRVLGLFQVSGQQKYGYYVDRTKAPSGTMLLPENPDFIYYDLRRADFVYKAGASSGCTGSPAYAECVPTYFRTNIKPLNWRD
jgi:hypothetical protein